MGRSVQVKYKETSKHPLYGTWAMMKQRCYNKNATSYSDYGAKGVVVCDRWRDSFKNFAEDMGDKPTNTTLDRINVAGQYSPDNCRWASKKVQGQNKRNRVSFDGDRCFIQVQATVEERKKLAEIAAHRGNQTTMSQVVRKWINDAHSRMEAKR